MNDHRPSLLKSGSKKGLNSKAKSFHPDCYHQSNILIPDSRATISQMPLIPFSDFAPLFAADHRADGADSYVLVEIERRMWPSSVEDIKRRFSGNEDVATCAICLDFMNADSSVTLPCNHCLHIECAQMSERYAILELGRYQVEMFLREFA